MDYLSVGRDGGGSRSGANSPAFVDGDVVPASGGGEDVGAAAKNKKGSLAKALQGKLDLVGDEERGRADALGDQSDVEDESGDEIGRLQKREGMVDGSVR